MKSLVLLAIVALSVPMAGQKRKPAGVESAQRCISQGFPQSEHYCAELAVVFAKEYAKEHPGFGAEMDAVKFGWPMPTVQPLKPLLTTMKMAPAVMAIHFLPNGTVEYVRVPTPRKDHQ